MTHEVSADVCVVGSGAAGSTVAEFVAAAGGTVVVLERGPRRRGARRGRDAAFESVGLPIGSPERVSRSGLGGDGLVWGRAVVEFDREDFGPRSWRPGWPLPVDEITALYPAARRRLGVPPARPAADTGSVVTLKPIDRSPVRFGDRPLPGQVLLETAATRILARGGRVESVDARSRRGPVTVRASHFVLAAGGIATPALLTASGLGPGDLVGRYFADHPYLTVPVELPPDAPDPEAIHGGSVLPPPMALFTLSEAVRRDRDLPGAATAFTPDRSAAVWDRPSVREWQRLAWGWRLREVPPSPLRTAATAVGGIPAVTRAAIDRRRARRRVSFRVVVEPIPNPESRVTAVPGSPIPQVDWRLGGRELESIRLLLDSVSERAAAEGWGPLSYGDVAWPAAIESGYHHMGATRMGADPAVGVVDPDCRVFGTDNLYVAGPSVFPTYSYANPMITTVALAIRLARHLGEQG